jgi:hypothetical protein
MHGARKKLAAMSTELRFHRWRKIITILSTGFQNDPVSRWLFPDDDARERLHPEFFGPIVQMALEDGEIYTTEDRSGTVLPPIIQTTRTISTCLLSPSGHSFSTRASERPCSAIAWLH